MRTFFKGLMFIAILIGMLSVFGGFAALHGIHELHDGSDMSVVVNGEELYWESGVGDWLGAGIGLFVAGVVVCLVVPLALLVGVALPLLIVGGVVAVVLLGLAGVGAVLGSPLIIIGFVAYLMLRNRRRARYAAASRVEPS
jgi:hypothetical protein